MAQAGAAGGPRGQAWGGVSARQVGRRWRSGPITVAFGPSVGPCRTRSEVAGSLPEGAGRPGSCPGCGNADRTPGSGMVSGAESRFPSKLFKNRVVFGFSSCPIPTKIPSRRSDVRVRFRQGSLVLDPGRGRRAQPAKVGVKVPTLPPARRRRAERGHGAARRSVGREPRPARSRLCTRSLSTLCVGEKSRATRHGACESWPVPRESDA